MAETMNGSPAAEVTGRLRLSSGCLFIGPAVAIWPKNTTWSEDDQTVSIEGAGTYRVGEVVNSGGGYFDLDEGAAQIIGDSATSAAQSCSGGDATIELALVSR